MTRFFYFKTTFLSCSAGMFTGLLFYGLFDVDFSNGIEIGNLILKSLAIGLVVGLVMGLLNMFFKIGNFSNRKSS
jgi:xanthosine utilization system XapX-like protein